MIVTLSPGAGVVFDACTVLIVGPFAESSALLLRKVAPAGSAVAKVELLYRSGNGGTYQRTALRDDGNSGDGAAGDGVYGATLPVAGTAGERVAWYVAATASNSYASMSFLPELAEREPSRLQFTSAAGTNGLRITEWMYAGVSGEFIELTNLSGAAIDLSLIHI